MLYIQICHLGGAELGGRWCDVALPVLAGAYRKLYYAKDHDRVLRQRPCPGHS
jgi:hypothetical protein